MHSWNCGINPAVRPKKHKSNSAIANLNFENYSVASIVATDGLTPIGTKGSDAYILHILCTDIIMRVSLAAMWFVLRFHQLQCAFFSPVHLISVAY